MAKKKYIHPAVAAWARELDIREVAEFLVEVVQGIQLN